MQARYVSRFDFDAALDPDAAVFRSARPVTVDLIGTPAGLQPSPAILASWSGKKIGAVDRVRVAAVHDARTLAFRLEWSDPTENREIPDIPAFVDAAAILLPSAPGAAAVTMGAPGAAVNAWYWRADEDGSGRDIVAEGIGTTRTVDRELVRGHGVWKNGGWRVVIARALRVATEAPVAQLRPGEATGFAVAVWEGSHQERAGIKSFSGDWRELRLDAAEARR